MKKAFYLFISVLLVLFSTNKVNDSKTIKRANEQTNKQEIILIYSSNDLWIYNQQVEGQTMRIEISNPFKVSTKRRYILALRTNLNNSNITAIAPINLYAFDISLNLNNGGDVYNYLMTNGEPPYHKSMSLYTKLSSNEGGYLTYYLSLLDYGNTNNLNEMQISITQNGPSDSLDFFIQDIYVYDITNITTQGETWYNYQSGADPAEIQTAYDKGYSDAVKSGTGLNWLQSAFNMIANILNIEILPNIKIAYLVAIPLLIELILFVLRFIK